jgi:hypothetical protein
MKRSISSFFVLGVFVLPMLMLGPFAVADNGPNHQVRNLNFGVSGGNVNDTSRRFCCSGTLGALVQDSLGSKYILSNNHVLGLSGAANAGDDVSQPGLIDNGCQIATVVADFTVAPPLTSNVDAAIAQLRNGLMDGTGSIEDVGTISSVVKAPSIGLSVAKSGRTTGFTTGSISSINATVSVRYSKSCGSGGGKAVTFTNQVVVGSSTFSAGGDSGSLIITNDNCHQPVALLFAGSNTATIGNPIGQVLTQLSSSLGRPVSFVGGNCSTSLTFEPEAVGPGESEILFATEAIRSREQELMSLPGVIGVGVGAHSEDPSRASIVVYVDVNTDSKVRLPKRISGLRVRKVFTQQFVAY